MIPCFSCHRDHQILAACAGDNCTARICPDCYQDDGLCSECRDEQRRRPARVLYVNILVTGDEMERRSW